MSGEDMAVSSGRQGNQDGAGPGLRKAEKVWAPGRAIAAAPSFYRRFHLPRNGPERLSEKRDPESPSLKK